MFGKSCSMVTSSEGKILGQAESRSGYRMSQTGWLQLVVTIAAVVTLVAYLFINSGH